MKKKIEKSVMEVFAKKAKYQGGEYLIECNGKILVDKNPSGLRLKFEKELKKAN